MRRHAFLRGERHRGEHRNALDELELGRRGDRAIELDEPAIREQREQRQDRADYGERRSRPDQVHDDRRRDRAERDSAHR
jgi:hypothetical protein